MLSILRSNHGNSGEAKLGMCMRLVEAKLECKSLAQGCKEGKSLVRWKKMEMCLTGVIYHGEKLETACFTGVGTVGTSILVRLKKKRQKDRSILLRIVFFCPRKLSTSLVLPGGANVRRT